jgi:hypothetical protein
MLQGLDEHADPEPYRGWSSTYTLSAILMQLYSFLLLDDNIGQSGGNSYNRAAYVVRLGSRLCSCGHCYQCMRLQGLVGVAPAAFETLQSCPCGHSCLGEHLTQEAAQAVEVARAEAMTEAAPSSPSSSSSPSPSSSSSHQQQGSSTPAASTPGGSSAWASQQTPAPWGPSSTAGAVTTPTTTTSSSSSGDSISAQQQAPLQEHLLQLDDYSLSLVLQQLPPQRLWPIITSTTSSRLAGAAMDVLQRQQQVCFYSKLPASETIILGFGVTRKWHFKSSSIKTLSTRSDYLAEAAFVQGVRRSAWNHRFDAFLPLYLNPRHGPHALALLPQYVTGMLDPSCSGKKVGRVMQQAVSPKELLTVMAQLINSQVVELMSTREVEYNWYTRTTSISRGMSDAALQTFCHLHHLLLAAALQPGSRLTEVALKEVQAFVDSPAGRGKQRCPDLGVLLVQLLLVPKEAVPWSKLAPVLLRELLARQVRWIIREAGAPKPGTRRRWGRSKKSASISISPEGLAFGRVHLELTNGTDGGSTHDLKRLKDHLRYGAVGLRNLMLQVWFANALARPSRQATLQQDLAAIKGSYDACSGMPPLRLFRAFNEQARYVLGCNSWQGVLHVLRLGVHESLHPRQAWVDILRQAVVDSYRAGYHSEPYLPPGRGWPVWEGEVPPVGVVSDRW